MRRLIALLLLLLISSPSPAAAPATKPAGDLYRPDNLVAWCIVPYDGKNRTPEQRAEMLHQLRFTRFAYDWRAAHLPQFETEIAALQKQGITLQAVWFPTSLNAEARKILETLQKAKIKTELWVSLADAAPK